MEKIDEAAEALFSALEAWASSKELHEGNPKLRQIGLYERDKVFVSTMRVYDSKYAYETAVGHPEYASGDLIIVENYDTPEEAQAGHHRWVATMTANTLPDSLRDVGGSKIDEICQSMGMLMVYERGKND